MTTTAPAPPERTDDVRHARAIVLDALARARAASATLGRSTGAQCAEALRAVAAVGDVVDLVGPDGVVVARGQASHPSSAVPAMLGRSSEELTGTGQGAPAELVHRDRLVLVGEGEHPR